MKKFLITVFLACVCCGFTAVSYSEEISIKGKVISLGKGVKGIEVNINNQIYETDANGYYKAEHIQTDTLPEIKIESKKFYSSPEIIKPEKIYGNMEHMNFIVYGEIKGQVTYNGIPMSNAVVKINDRQQEYITDSDGNYKISNVGLNKEYTVSVSSKGYTIEPKKIILNSEKSETEVSSETVEITKTSKNKKDVTMESSIFEEQEDNVLNFEAEVSKYSVTITVMKGLMPLGNTEITINNDKRNKYKTDDNGICKIENLVYDGKYIFKAEKKGAVFTKRIQTINSLTRDEKINFDAFLDVSGNVSIDNEPFANVIIECGDRKVKTDKNGNYSFINVEPNKAYEIKAVSSIFDFEPKQISIKSLKNSITENNFKTVSNTQSTKDESSEKIKMLQQEKKIKLNAQKEEAARIEKEEKAKQKAVDAKTKKIIAEEDLKVKEESLQEKERIKEKKLKEEKEIAEYKAALEAEAERGKTAAEDRITAKIKKNNMEQDAQAQIQAQVQPAQSAQPAQPAEEAKKEQSVEDSAAAEPTQPAQEELLTIQGRVMENKNGVADVQIMLIMPPETKKYSTDINGFYKISGLVKNKNYVITVLADTKTANLSPKSRIYKDLNTSMKNQNFYYVIENKTENVKKEIKK